MKPNSLRRATCAALLALGISASTASAAGPDLDGDGIPNIVDPDIDNDGIPNALDRNVDGGIAKYGPFAGQYIGDHLDNENPAERDIDGDGQNDDSLADADIDGDGKRDDDALETDIDGDGRVDDSPAETDIDGDGRNNDDDRDFDIDGDGLDDDDIAEMDIDGDSRLDDTDEDLDGDNRYNADSTELDTDGDGRPDDSADESNDDGDRMDDRLDPDDDNDGIPDNADPDHHNEIDEQEVEATLTRQAVAPGSARCRVEIQRMGTGKVELKVKGEKFPAGAYDIIIDGMSIGQLHMSGGGGEAEGEQEWETNPEPGDEDDLPLTIPVIGRPVSVEKNGVVWFNGTIPEPPPPDGTTPLRTEAHGRLLRDVAAPASAEGNIEAYFRADGLTTLEIEVEKIPAGTYTVSFGSSPRGSLSVALNQQGKIRFDTTPESGDVPLDFPAAGLPLTISQGAVVYFTGTIPAAPPGVGDGHDPAGGTPVLSTLAPAAAAPLNAGAMARTCFGSAGAVLFEIETSHLPAGLYDVTVGGALRGTLTVSASTALLGFAVTPLDVSVSLLDFPVSGQPLTISQAGVIYFSGTAPVSPAL